MFIRNWHASRPASESIPRLPTPALAPELRPPAPFAMSAHLIADKGILVTASRCGGCRVRRSPSPFRARAFATTSDYAVSYTGPNYLKLSVVWSSRQGIRFIERCWRLKEQSRSSVFILKSLAAPRRRGTFLWPWRFCFQKAVFELRILGMCFMKMFSVCSGVGVAATGNETT